MKGNNPLPHVELSEHLHRKASWLHLPVSGTFELSPECNFSCRMCYIRKTAREVAAHERPILKLEDWLRIARQAREEGLLYLLLTGGEPLMWPDFWPLYEALVDMGFLVSINTNGSLIDEAAVARFRRRPPRRIHITLYGAEDSTYLSLCGVDNVFSQVEKGIRLLLDAGIMVKLNCSLTPRNAQDMERIVEYAKRQDLPLTMVTYMFPPVRRDSDMVGTNHRFTPEEAAEQQLRYFRYRCNDREYEKILRDILAGSVELPGMDEGCVDPADGKIRCRAGKASFWISWDGWMQACGMMAEPKTSITDKSFAQAWAWVVDATDRVRTSSVCQNCSSHKICHACAAMAWTETGDCAGTPEYSCRMVRHMQRLAREVLNPGSVEL